MNRLTVPLAQWFRRGTVALLAAYSCTLMAQTDKPAAATDKPAPAARKPASASQKPAKPAASQKLAAAAVAQGKAPTVQWPTKAVSIVVPFAPGGTTDVVARMVGQKLSEIWGQPVLIENRAGAGGNIGAGLVSKATPDGHTLLMASGSIFTVNPHLYRKLPFDPQKDFIPVTKVASGPMVVVVPRSSDVKNVRELIAKAKAKPGSINFGSAGTGSQVHMAGESFANAADINIVHVPYKGEAPAYGDLMSGQIQLMVGNIGAAASLVNDGLLRAIAVTGKERSQMLPNVPTVAESGLPGFENTGWFGFMAPTGTPKDVVDKIRRDTASALNETHIKARLSVQGMTPAATSPAEFAKAIDEESKKWAAVVKNRKLSVD
jgi:tripartite-type tricarboxylate transporter receptor subunit TctC